MSINNFSNPRIASLSPLANILVPSAWIACSSGEYSQYALGSPSSSRIHRDHSRSNSSHCSVSSAAVWSKGGICFASVSSASRLSVSSNSFVFLTVRLIVLLLLPEDGRHFLQSLSSRLTRVL